LRIPIVSEGLFDRALYAFELQLIVAVLVFLGEIVGEILKVVAV
jgi:hypothetical protein